jgi:hypothetical protein
VVHPDGKIDDVFYLSLDAERPAGDGVNRRANNFMRAIAVN